VKRYGSTSIEEQDKVKRKFTILVEFSSHFILTLIAVD